MPRQPIIRAFFDEPTNTVSYLVADPATKQAAVIDPVLDYDHNAGEVDTRSVEAILKAGGGGRLHDRLGAGDPRPCRPSVRRALYQGQDRRKDRHRRAHQGRAAHLPADLQRHRSEDRRQRFRPSVQGRRALQHRRAERRGALHARPHAGRHHLQDRGCRLRRRHAVHAGLRHRARRLPGRRRAPALPLDQAAAGAARPRRGCSCATTTRRPAATPMPGRRRSREQREKNVHVKDGVDRRRVRRDAHGARRHAVGAARCCCLRSRSTSAPASSRRPRPTACAISRSP